MAQEDLRSNDNGEWRVASSHQARLGLIAVACAALLPSLGAAQTNVQSGDSDRLAITIYNQDRALVEDTRRIDLKSGRQRVEFPNVSARIQSETVVLTGRAFGIVEQNFDFDLLTPSKMMEKAVGSTVRLVRTNPATGKEQIETAEILSVVEGVVLRIGDRIEVLRDDGLPVRVLFDRIPENLRARPTLSVTVDSTEAGARPLTLRYLTGGLSWAADYVALFDEKAGKLDLQGWVTLTNQSGASYRNALTQLVAGNVGEEPEQPVWSGYWRRGENRRIAGVKQAGTGGEPEGTEFQDYRLYTLPEATTIAENQTKQISLIDAKAAEARKIYRIIRGGFQSDRNPENASVKVGFTNSKSTGLGVSLPAGTVRFYARDKDGRAQFIGENRIGHTPQGSDVELEIGAAFDVTLQATVVRQEPVVEGVTRTVMRYVFRNARAEPANVQLVQTGLNRVHEFETTSIPPEKVDASTEIFIVPVPAKGETVLTFQVKEGRPITRKPK